MERMVPPLVHELRNVLAALTMALDLADARLATDAATAASLPSLRAAAGPVITRANGMLQGLAELVNPPQIRCVPFDLATLVCEVAQASPSPGGIFRAPQAAPVICMELAEHADVIGDRAATATALHHLLENAQEALSRGGGRCTLTLEALHQHWALHVIDDGPGVANGIKKQLFSPFVGAKRRHLGLGLTSAWRSMQAQGGTLTLTDAAKARFGRGASFCLTLPRAQKRKPADGSAVCCAAA